MSESISTAQILKAIEDLREDVRHDIAEVKAEVKADNREIWKTIHALSETVSTGKGAVRALVWIGGILIAIASVVATLIGVFSRH